MNAAVSKNLREGLTGDTGLTVLRRGRRRLRRPRESCGRGSVLPHFCLPTGPGAYPRTTMDSSDIIFREKCWVPVVSNFMIWSPGNQSMMSFFCAFATVRR